MDTLDLLRPCHPKLMKIPCPAQEATPARAAPRFRLAQYRCTLRPSPDPTAHGYPLLCEEVLLSLRILVKLITMTTCKAPKIAASVLFILHKIITSNPPLLHIHICQGTSFFFSYMYALPQSTVMTIPFLSNSWNSTHSFIEHGYPHFAPPH